MANEQAGYGVGDVLRGMRGSLEMEERGHRRELEAMVDDVRAYGRDPERDAHHLAGQAVRLAVRAAKIATLREWIKAVEGISLPVAT